MPIMSDGLNDKAITDIEARGIRYADVATIEFVFQRTPVAGPTTHSMIVTLVTGRVVRIVSGTPGMMELIPASVPATT